MSDYILDDSGDRELQTIEVVTIPVDYTTLESSGNDMNVIQDQGGNVWLAVISNDIATLYPMIDSPYPHGAMSASMVTE